MFGVPLLNQGKRSPVDQGGTTFLQNFDGAFPASGRLQIHQNQDPSHPGVGEGGDLLGAPLERTQKSKGLMYQALAGSFGH